MILLYFLMTTGKAPSPKGGIFRLFKNTTRINAEDKE